MRRDGSDSNLCKSRVVEEDAIESETALLVEVGSEAGEGARQEVVDERLVGRAVVDERGGRGDGGAEVRLGNLCLQEELEGWVAQDLATGVLDDARLYKKHQNAIHVHVNHGE